MRRVRIAKPSGVRVGGEDSGEDRGRSTRLRDEAAVCEGLAGEDSG